jgi:alkylation response protein AidB-like acyl-CoA dehydrogenase
MDFSFNQDQLLIADSAAAFLSSVSSSDSIRTSMQSEQGYDSALWTRVTQEMGWQLTHIPEAYDGLGLGYVELCILFEQMGQHLFCAPFLSTTALAINALLVAGSDQQKTKHLANITSGDARYTLAYSAAGRHWGVESVSAEYELCADGAVINGQYHYVVDGHTADYLIVAARKTTATGLALFIVPASDVERIWTPSMDQTRKIAQVSLNKVQVASDSILMHEGEASQALSQILALSNIAIAAEQMGVAEKSLSLSVDYIAERKQFGRVVGSFQAMKHKAADMMTKVEAARSAVYYAACIADEFLQGSPLGDELEEAASIAKAYCCEAAFYNAGVALQMHGGVGFTWEYDVHLYFKRAKAAQLSFGDNAFHKERIARIALGEPL